MSNEIRRVEHIRNTYTTGYGSVAFEIAIRDLLAIVDDLTSANDSQAVLIRAVTAERNLLLAQRDAPWAEEWAAHSELFNALIANDENPDVVPMTLGQLHERLAALSLIMDADTPVLRWDKENGPRPLEEVAASSEHAFGGVAVVLR
jgi:hypothetical protein